MILYKPGRFYCVVLLNINVQYNLHFHCNLIIKHSHNEIIINFCICYSSVQKKYILQTGTTADGVPIIDVVPIDNSDSNDEAPITVSTIVTSDSESLSPTNLTSSNTGSQQVTAQVSVVQAQNSDNGGAHFITVSGKCFLFSFSFYYQCIIPDSYG